MSRLAPALLILIGLATVANAADVKDDIDRGKALLKEGDTLAEKSDTTEAVIRYKQAFEALLPGLRKLPFKSEVKRDVTAREDLKAFLIKEIDEDMTPAEFRASELGMKALGFIPADFDLKEMMIKVYSEEIAAFYDPRTKTMHLIKEPEVKGGKQPSLLEKLMGKKGGFDKDENKTVIAHELTHALTDQHYDLDSMQKAVKGDDDQGLALAALIEGDATLAMMGAQMDDWSGDKIDKLPAKDLERVMTFLMPMMKFAGGQTLKSAPPILTESLVFPYLRGLVFCAKLTNDGGWPALDDAYKNPPRSTEQILHPEKFRTNPDAPTIVDLGKLDPGAGWKEAGGNVVGEMQIGIMLGKLNGKKAAEGWDGDRYSVFEGTDGKLGLVWISTWDTENDAREFARSYARYQTKKIGPDTAALDAFPDVIRRTRGDEIFAVERRGMDVAIVENFPAAITDTLLESAFKSKKTELISALPKKAAE